MALIPPFFLDCVVAIGFPGDDGKARYAATGFLYGHLMEKVSEEQKRYRIFLVSNRHVFESERIAFLRFNPEGAEPAREYDLPLLDADGNRVWKAHSDPEVDIAVIGINANLLREHGIRFEWFRDDQHRLNRESAKAQAVTEGDAVFVLGFPMGLVGEQRNFVVVRQGVIARIRDCLETIRKEFLVDCAVFPGNSGGPVVTRPEMMSISGTKSANAAHLLGVVASYVPYRDVAISTQTKRPRVIFEENSGLASAFPIDYVDDIVPDFLAPSLPPPVIQEAAPPEKSASDTQTPNQSLQPTAGRPDD